MAVLVQQKILNPAAAPNRIQHKYFFFSKIKKKKIFLQFLFKKSLKK